MISLKKILLILAISISIIFLYRSHSKIDDLPIIAIANFGPHSSLEETIQGIKDGLKEQGFKENENIKFVISDVNFDPHLIRQMLANQLAMRPKVLVPLSTPVAQAAKSLTAHVPIIFASITDPVAAGLLKFPDRPDGNITGASDRQDLNLLTNFIRQILPHSKTIGMFYSTSEVNDIALLNMMKQATEAQGLDLLAIPVNHAREIQMQIHQFSNKVDAIYVGNSGVVQPSLPVIAEYANKMKIPVFNFSPEEVISHQAFASFGVSYYEVGKNASLLIAEVLKNVPAENIKPNYPNIKNYRKVISQTLANRFNINIPVNIENVEVVK